MSMMLGISSSNTKRLEIKDMSGKVVGSITITKGKASQTVVKKRLPYSFKEISTRLLNTKKSGNAQRVLLSAKQKVASLRLMYKGGVYDDDEVFAALMHAQAISRVAKKRVKHLEEEERAERKIGRDGEDGSLCEADIEEKTEEATAKQTYKEETEQKRAKLDMQRMQKLMEKYERMMQEAMKELEQLENMDELSDGMGISGEISMDPEDLELMKKKHRADEMRAIVEADMKYLKFMFDKLEKEKQSNSVSSYSSISYNDNSSGSDSVSLELGGVDIPVEAAPDAMAIVEGGAVDVGI